MQIEDDNQTDTAAEKTEHAEQVKPSEPKDEADEAEAEGDSETEGTDADEAEAEETEDGDKEDADGETDETGDEDKPKRTPRSQRYQRRIERLERENSALRSRSPASQSADDIAREVDRIVGKPPQEADFKGDYLAFERALTVYDIRKSNAEDRVKENGERQQVIALERKRAAIESHQDRVEEFKAKAKDFDAVLKGASDLKASPVVEDLVLDSDKSAHLVYFLAKNPQRLHALNGMSERDAAREVGRIESRLSLPQPKTKTQAPKPVTPPKGGTAPKSAEGDLDAWLKKTYG